MFSSAVNFNVYSSDNQVVATAHIDPATHTLKLTYTKYAETHSNITGSIQAAIRVDTEKITSSRTIPVTIQIGQTTIPVTDYHYQGIVGDYPNERFAKWGWQAASDTGNTIGYALRVNATGETLNNVSVHDTLKSAGMSYDTGSFHIYHGVWKYNNTTRYWEMQGTQEVTDKVVTYAPDGRSFTIDFGNLNGDGYLVRYAVNLNHTPVNNEIFNNYAEVIHEDNKQYQDANNNYTWQSASGQANGYNYTLTLTKQSTSGTRLQGAVFTVVRDRSGETVSTATSDANGNITISGLLRDDYTITETQAPAGYKKADPIHVHANQFTNSANTAHITVTDVPDMTSVKVSKTWQDTHNQDGTRPDSISVQLYGNDSPVGAPVTLNEDNQWTHEFTQLPVVDNTGKSVTYTVKEVNTPTGYTSTITGDQEHGYTITNTHTPEVTTVKGKKTWDDNNNQDGIRPDSITVTLMANGHPTLTTVASANTNWEYSFTNLPVYSAGKKITYTVTENPVTGYTTHVNGYNITNTHTPEVTSVKGKKTWNDNNNQDGIRPDSVTVNLLADGTKIASTTVTKDNNWAYEFTNLPVNKDGKKIVYTLEETPVDGYTSSVHGYDITNTHTPDVTSISLTKVWEDKNNKKGSRPDSISVQLYANGQKVGEPVTVSQKNNWTHTFTQLPVNKDGKKITYTVEEVDTPTGYTSTITGDQSHGFTITNTATPTVPVTPLAHTGATITRIAILALGGVILACISLMIRRARKE